MKSMLWGALVVCGAFAVGCTTTTTDGGGGGGTGGDTGEGGSTSGPVTVSTGTGVSTQTCADVATVCISETGSVTEGCIDCAVNGDSTVATDGGACTSAFNACFGDGSETCAGATVPSCCEVIDCLTACEEQFPDTESAEYLNCICTNDGTQCAQQQTDTNTCLGAEGGIEGIQAYFAVFDCFYGEDGTSGVCGAEPDCASQ